MVTKEIEICKEIWGGMHLVDKTMSGRVEARGKWWGVKGEGNMQRAYWHWGKKTTPAHSGRGKQVDNIIED